jgi:hypothetical protein
MRIKRQNYLTSKGLLVLAALTLLAGLNACDRREKLPDRVEYMQPEDFEQEKDSLARFGSMRFKDRAYKPRMSTRNEVGYTNSGKAKKSRKSRAGLSHR